MKRDHRAVPLLQDRSSLSNPVVFPPTLVFARWVICDEKCVEWGFTSPSVSIFVSSHTWKWEKAIFGLSVCVLSKHVLKSLCSELPWMLQLSSALQSVL